jgi:hypothetical protein
VDVGLSEEVADGGGTDLMFWFWLWLERGGDEAKRCRKMKWMQQARLTSIERKCDTARRRGDID